MMAKVTLALIKQVREDTGAGMLAVKKALDKADGDPNKAKDILREEGVQEAGKRQGRKAQQGLVAYRIVDEDGKKVGYALELNSETDFVAETPQFVKVGEKIIDAAVAAHAKNADEVLNAPTDDGKVSDTITQAAALFKEHIKLGVFQRIEGDNIDFYAHKKSQEFPPSTISMIATDAKGASIAHDVALQISAMSPRWLKEEDVPADVVKHEEEVEANKFRAAGKPEKIIPMIVKGSVKSFYKETVLLDQEFVKDPHKSVGQLFKENGAQAQAFLRIEVGKADAEKAAEKVADSAE
jgi:elongation factor Ts